MEIFHLDGSLSFATEAPAFVQLKLLCGTSLFLYHSPLSRTIPSGNKGGVFFMFPTLNLCRMQVNSCLKILGISRLLMDIHMPWHRRGEFPELQLQLPLIHRVKLIQLNIRRQVLSHKLISED